MLDKNRLALFNQVLESTEAEVVIKEIMDFMTETAAKPSSNAEWVKGMGMALEHLKQLRRDYQNEKLNERKNL